MAMSLANWKLLPGYGKLAVVKIPSRFKVRRTKRLTKRLARNTHQQRREMGCTAGSKIRFDTSDHTAVLRR
jgi:hypothetical protein